MKKIVVFASGKGTTFDYLIREGHGQFYRVKALFTNNKNAGATDVAKQHDIPVYFTTEEGWKDKLYGIEPDLLIDAGYLKLIDADICKRYSTRFINTHPSLLPKYGGKGFYGHHVHQAVLDGKDPVTGITIHYLSECYDDGAVINQCEVPVEEGDTLETLTSRVQEREKPFLLETIKELLKDLPRRALISVYDKKGILELARFLESSGTEIISSGGTYQYLKEAGVEVSDVESVTQFPEILGGRVKTLHPHIHGGILARRDDPHHLETLSAHDIKPLDMVVVNLYPFKEMLQQHLSFQEMVEYIDIGGPSMLRSAAKNHQDVIVLQSPHQYQEFMERFEGRLLTATYRKELAAEVFKNTSSYDAKISAYLSGDDREWSGYEKKQKLRYGENPHQEAFFYEKTEGSGFLKDMIQHQGKELSYSNLCDIDAAYGSVSRFEETTAVAVKHNTPCAIAQGSTVLEAYEKCHAGDPVSIFGGIVALNRPVDQATAEKLIETFLEVVCAPGFDEEALEVFKSKKNLRVIEITGSASLDPLIKSVSGGLLIQDPDDELYQELKVVTKREPTEAEMDELLFAYRCVKEVKSNAIVVVKDYATVGIGGGQVNRIDAARLALRETKGAVILASDGFFPFDDVVRLAHEQGITHIIQPGGSLQDQKSIDACDECGMVMVFTGMRHFKH